MLNTIEIMEEMPLQNFAYMDFAAAGPHNSIGV